MRVYEAVLRYVLDHPNRVLAAWGLLTLVALALLPFPPYIYNDLDDTLPQNGEIAETIRLSEKYFGPSEYLVVGIFRHSAPILDERGIEYLRAVNARLQELKGVRKQDVISVLSDRAQVVERIAEDVRISRIVPDTTVTPPADELARRLDQSSIYKNLVSPDRKAALFLVRIANQKISRRLLIDTVNQMLADLKDPDYHSAVGGQPAQFAAIDRYSQNVFFVLPLTLLLIGLIHLEAFRSIQGLAFPLATAVMSAIIAQAIMEVFGVKLNGFTSVAPILIVALTAGHAVQMLKRYSEEYLFLQAKQASGTSIQILNRQAIERAFRSLAPVMLAACAVAALSFASLAVFQLPVIRDFGLFVATGVMCGLLIELTMIPALRLKANPDKVVMNVERESVWNRLLRILAAGVATKNIKITMVVWIIGIILMAVLAANISINHSQDNYFAKFTQIRKDQKALNEGFAGSNVLYVLFEGEGENSVVTASIAALIVEIQKTLSVNPQIGASASYMDAVRELGCRFDEKFCRDNPVAWTDKAVRNFLYLYSSGAAPGAMDDFVTPNGDAALIRVFARTDSSAFVADTFGELRRRYAGLLPPGVRMSLGGTGAATLAINDRFVKLKIANIAQILFIAAFVSSIFFRSLMIGSLIAIPLLVSTIASFAAMTMLGISLNVATVTIAAVSVGIGSDYAIYFCMRLRDFLRNDANTLDDAMRMTYMTAGKAALFVACAVAGGFLGLTLSVGYNVHLWLGLIVSIGMLASIGASLSLLPALLIITRPSAIFR